MKYIDAVRDLLGRIQGAGFQAVVTLDDITDHGSHCVCYPELKHLSAGDFEMMLVYEAGRFHVPIMTYDDDRGEFRELEKGLLLEDCGFDPKEVVVCCDHHVPKYARNIYTDEEIGIIKRRVTFALICPCCVAAGDKQEVAPLRKDGFRFFGVP